MIQGILLFLTLVQAQAPKRFAAIDVESSILSRSEKDLILKTARDKVTKWKVWSVVSKEEVNQKLSQPNARKVEFDKIVQENKDSADHLNSQLQSAISLYQQSRFFEALKSFEEIMNSVGTASLDLSSSFTRDLFQIYSASAFFEDRQLESRSIILALKTLDPTWKMNPDQFPPNLIEISELVSGQESEIKQWNFQSDQKDFEAKFWGFDLTVFRGEKFRIDLPVKDAYLKKAALVLTKEGYLPQILSLDSLPEKIQWLSLAEKNRSTHGLFGPLGSLTANPELKWFISQLQLSVVMLISVEKTNGRWQLQGQWYEGATGRSSEVREVRATEISLGTEALLDAMINDIAPDGRVIDPRGYAGAEPARISESKPFYTTWWFLTLAGVGLAGAAAGTYAALNSSDSLKFQVKAAP